MYGFNTNSTSEELMANALEFTRGLIELENKYHIMLDADCCEDWDEDLDGNEVMIGAESYVTVLSENGHEICDLEYLRDMLKEQDN